MPNEADESSESVTIEFTPGFKRNLRRLARKYRRIKSDLTPLIKALEAGETPGNQIPGTEHEKIYKVRVANSDRQRGKSGGYRVIYTAAAAMRLVLVTIYSKTEQADVSIAEFQKILAELNVEEGDPEREQEAREAIYGRLDVED